MARHRTVEEMRELQERARQLRAEGRSRREIQAELGIGADLCGQFLAGTQVPECLRRPLARDDLRATAEQMRAAGCTYDDIAVDLGVSKSTLSSWLRDHPHSVAPPCADAPNALGSAPPTDAVTDRREAARVLRGQGLLLKEIAQRLDLSIKTVSLYTNGMPWPARAKHGGGPAHVRAMSEARWRPYRRRRDAAAHQRKLDAARAVGHINQTLLLLGAVAYWCEGTKSKPWRPHGQWTFINSDPMLMRLMILWLRMLAIPPEWVVRIQIHETGDLPAAEAYWRHVLGLTDLVFGKATIKRHKPLTTRKNVGQNYHGCVCIYVRCGAELLQQVEGWMVGALFGAGGALPDDPMPWQERCDTDFLRAESIDKPSAVG